MRNKAPLALMEQLMMVLVFALAAALCLQVFIFSDRSSRRKEAVNRAVLEAQNAAEELKSVHGDFTRAAELYGGSYDGRTWDWSYDENWKKDNGTAYHLLVLPADGGPMLLGSAEVTVYTAEGDVLVSLPVAWQEVDARG